MCPDQFRTIGIEPFVWAYLYPNLLGSFLIWLAMEEMRKLISHKPLKKYAWQPHLTGIIERTLYLISFLIEHPEFVVAWLAFKVAGGWKVWSKSEDGGDGKEKCSKKDEHWGRAVYSNMFNGSALSILYAGVGYLFIVWWKDRCIVFWLAGLLVGLTLLLWIALWIWGRHMTKKKQVHP